MASDVMRVRLHLREIRVLAVVSDTPSELRVEVESTVRRPALPGVRVRLHPGARHPPAQGARSGGVGAAHDAGVDAAPVRVRQLLDAPSRGPSRVREQADAASGPAGSSRTRGS